MKHTCRGSLYLDLRFGPLEMKLTVQDLSGPSPLIKILVNILVSVFIQVVFDSLKLGLQKSEFLSLQVYVLLVLRKDV